jgi:phosphotriesterase-related protein
MTVTGISHDATGAGHVMTVRGPVDPSAIGPTMMHEHIFIDTRGYSGTGRIELEGDRPDEAEPIDSGLANAPFDARVSGPARYALWGYPANMVISSTDDFDLMASELGEFTSVGGSCIVDMTPIPLSPDPTGVRRMAEYLDLHAVIATGIYTHDFHPEWVEHASVEQIAQFFLTELRGGVGGSVVRPGVIGEIGTSPKPLPCEGRVLRAAARAAAETDTAVNVHTRFPILRDLHAMIDAAEAEGLPAARLWFSHLDEVGDHSYHVQVLKRGVSLGFDGFGQDGYFTASWKSRSDNERSRSVADLVACGFAPQIVLGHDICRKHLLRRYGGLGYDHVISRVLPRLRSLFRVDDAAIDTMLVTNPRRLLTRRSAPWAVDELALER